METLAAPVLDATLTRVLRRERARRRNAALVRTAAALAVAVTILALWRIYDRYAGTPPLPLAGVAAALVFVAMAGLAATIAGAVARSESEVARDLDRLLGLDDGAAAALSVRRGQVAGGLAPFVLREVERALATAGPRVDAAFPDRASRSARRPLRIAWTLALAAVVAALFAELLTVDGPIHLLPGVSRPGGRPTEDAAPTAHAPQHETEEPKKAEEPRAQETKPPAPPEKKQDEPPASQGDVDVLVKTAKPEFDGDEPVLATVSATRRGDPVGSPIFDVRVDVDGTDEDSGALLHLDPRGPTGESVDLDLRKVPGLKLPPGEHELRARLTTRTTHEEHVSPPVRFRIRPPQGGGEGGGKPKDEPQRAPEVPPPQEKPDPKKPGAPQPLPPTALQKHVVTPLFREGEEVTKKGLVLVLDPGDGRGAAGPPKPLEEALPDAKRHAEELVDDAHVAPEDRDLVRRYFELLEALRR